MPPELAGKIAAGEVVQRPASVVRELLDNAVDAGADRIEIDVQQSGRTLIRVRDNGCGMGPEDLSPCFLQHATSKIHTIDDLYRIRTLGFRGEAMASIAAVAQVEVKTRRPEDETGHLYEVHGSEERRAEPTAAEPGTVVTVRNLFYNLPARRQFLKTDATEFRHILRTVQQAALAHLEISFTLTADGETIYRLPASTLEERVATIFGKPYRSSLIPFEEKTSFVNIRGVLGDPKVTRRSRGEQFLFVNGRPVQHRILTHIILKVYDAWTGEGDYPFYAIYLELDPTGVDVNVHPAKLEVQFEEERNIIQLVRSVVRKALNQYLMVPDFDAEAQDDGDPFDISFLQPGSGSMKEEGRLQLPSRINTGRPGMDGNRAGELLYGTGSKEKDESGEMPAARDTDREVESRSPEMATRSFWQLHNRYILTPTRTGLCLVDQHVAHVRIIYEKALNATEEALPGTQQLLFAQTLELSATDHALLKELLPVIQRIGFSIQLLSGHTVIINGVPADIDIGDEREVLRDMLQEYRSLDRKVKMDARRKVAISFARKTAIPRGRPLNAEVMELLLDQLFACEDPYRDPMDRPTLIYLSLDELKNRFR